MHYRLKRNRSGYYEARWTGADQNTRSHSLRTKNKVVAERRLDQFVTAREQTSSGEVTIASICDDYLTTHGPEVKNPDQIRYALLPIKKYMGNLLPDQINDTVIKRYVTQRAGYAKSSIRRELANLRAAIYWSARNRNTKKQEFKIPVTHSAPRQEWLTRLEARDIEDCIETPHIRLFFAMALLTGQRGNAICDLEWEYVDFEKNVIDFDHKENRSLNKLRTIVPINDQLKPLLEVAYRVRTTDWVIEHNGKRVKSTKTGMRTAYRRAGMSHLKSKKHILRHTAATWMVMDRIEYEEIGRYMGMSAKMVEYVYGHHHPDFLWRAASSLKY